MELRQIRHFVTLAETLNYRIASARLHIAQPPLSVSIRRLEEELGVTLFERSRRGTRLTPAGAFALEDARRLLLQAEQFTRSAREITEGTAGTIAVGYVASASFSVLPRMLPEFRKAYPKVQLRLIESTSLNILPMVESGELNVGLLRLPLPRSTAATIQLVQPDPLIAALPDRKDWRRQKVIELRTLAHEPFVLQSQDVGTTSTVVLQACQAAGFVPNMAQQASLLQTVISLVQCGIGVALVPSVTRLRPVPGVLFRELRGKGSGFDVGIALAWMQSRDTPATRRFREHVVESG